MKEMKKKFLHQFKASITFRPDKINVIVRSNKKVEFSMDFD